MKNLYLIQIGLLVLGGVAILIGDSWSAAASYACGALLILFNVVILAWAFRRLLQKKLIALSTGLIVFKYAILGTILYQILKASWLSPLWFCVGVGTLMLAAFGTALSSEGESTWLLP